MFVVAMRTPGSWAHQQLYAEDGVIFFREQALYGWTFLFHTYNGYFHLIPRLIAFIASAAPAVYEPSIYAIFSVAIQTLAAAFFLLPQNRIVVRSDALRLAVSILTLADFQSAELMNDIMPMQWYVMPVALLMLLHLGSREMPLSRAQVVLYCVLMAIIGLTLPLLLVVTPLAALIFVFRARGLEKLVPATMIAAAAIQIIAFETQNSGLAGAQISDPHSPFPIVLPFVATIGSWVYRDILTLTLGENNAIYLGGRYGESLAEFLFVLVLAVCFVVWKRGPRPTSELFLGATGMGIALVAVSLVVRKLLPFFADLTHYDFFGGGARYYYVPGWLVILAAAILVERFGPAKSPHLKAAILLAVFGLGAVNNYQAEELPDRKWSSYAPAIDDWKRKHSLHQRTPHVVVPITPEGWAVDLPEE